MVKTILKYIGIFLITFPLMILYVMLDRNVSKVEARIVALISCVVVIIFLCIVEILKKRK